MKNGKIAWTLLVIIVSFCLAASWMACRGIPDDEPGSLAITVDLPGAGAASGGETKVVKDQGYGIAGTAIPQPGTTVYHLRVHISDPSETFYVLNYVPGNTVTLMVQNGDGRRLDLEAYMIPGATLVNQLSSSFYQTASCTPGCTLDLSGKAVSVSVNTVIALPGTTVVNSNTVMASTPGGDVVIPVAFNCPRSAGYAANIVDLDWGLAMPTVPLNFPPLTISNFPRNKNFAMEIWHQNSDIQEFVSFTTLDLFTTQLPNPIYFQGYQTPAINLYPDRSLTNVPNGTTVDVLTDPVGGWSPSEPAVRDGLSYNANDTCNGTMSGATYTFTATLPGCTIGVLTFECDSSQILRQATVTVVP